MSVNRDLPHVMVLPEDDANRDLANGFYRQLDQTRLRQLQVLPAAGGWIKVLDRFLSNQVRDMNRYPGRFMVLLIDFDGNEERLQYVHSRIPGDLADRVFVLGVLTKPEKIRGALGRPYETIGSAMAEDCREGTGATWGHELLRHNAGELGRLNDSVRPILFPAI